MTMGSMERSIESHSAMMESLFFRSSAEGRKHAATCRGLAANCLTEDGERTLYAIADDYDREADQLEKWGY